MSSPNHFISWTCHWQSPSTAYLPFSFCLRVSVTAGFEAMIGQIILEQSMWLPSLYSVNWYRLPVVKRGYVHIRMMRATWFGSEDSEQIHPASAVACFLLTADCAAAAHACPIVSMHWTVSFTWICMKGSKVYDIFFFYFSADFAQSAQFSQKHTKHCVWTGIDCACALWFVKRHCYCPLLLHVYCSPLGMHSRFGVPLCCIACALQSPVVVVGALSRSGIKRQSIPRTQTEDLLGKEVRQEAEHHA